GMVRPFAPRPSTPDIARREIAPRSDANPPSLSGDTGNDMEATTSDLDSPEAGLLELLHLPRNTPIIGLKRSPRHEPESPETPTRSAPFRRVDISEQVDNALSPDISREMNAPFDEQAPAGEVSSEPESIPGGVDVEKIAQEVYQVLRNRLRIERERRHRP